MRRDGETIVFDDVDKSRYPGLPEFIPLEWTPGLFEELTEQQRVAVADRATAQTYDVMDLPEHIRQHKLAETHRRLHDLGVLKAQLGMLAPDEIAASIPVEITLGLPAGELQVLDQE